MRTIVIIGAVATALMADAGSGAQAARWCAGPSCEFHSYRQCRQAMGGGAVCHRQVAARAARAVPAVHGAPLAAPSRPAWASPFECYYDEGYGRYRACNAGGSVP